MFCTVETKRKPLNSLKFRGFHLFAVILRGATRKDTRIFSPLLYQLSYGTNLLFSATVVSRLRLQRYAKFWNLQIFWQKKKEKVINRFMNPVQNSQKTFP